MEFWNDLSRKITDAANVTVKETEKLTGIAKLRYKLSGAKNKLGLLYQGIGKLKFEEETMGKETPAELYEGLFAQVAEVIAEMDAIKEELAKIGNYKYCPSCGQKLSREMLFCPNCGQKQPEMKTEPAPESPAAEEADAPSEEIPEEKAEGSDDNNGSSL